MKLREWATPLTMGSFALIAATGVLMFFHLDTRLNKVVHEWLSWALLGGVVLHATANSFAFVQYFRRPAARWIMVVFVLVLGASFLPLAGQGGKPPPVVAAQALLDAPIELVAQVAGQPAGTVIERLNAGGISIAPGQTLRQAAQGEAPMKALGLVFQK